MKTKMKTNGTLATFAALVSAVSFCACGRHETEPADAVEPAEKAAPEAVEPEEPEVAEAEPAKPESVKAEPV